MTTMQTVVLIAHTFIALLIIVLVLLQRGKGADAGAAFGAGSSGTVFGARGSSSFFSRATAVLAAAFFASSLALAFMSSQRGGDAPDSLIEGAPAVEVEEEAEPEGDETLPDMPQLDDEPEPAAADDMPSEPEEPAADDSNEADETGEEQP